MDDDSYYEPDEKPRIQVAKGGPLRKIHSEGAKPSRTEKLISLAAALVLFVVSVMSGGMFLGIVQIVAFWLGCSLVLGPFAPLEYTGGDCRVGLGPPLPDPPVETDETADDAGKPRIKSRGGLKRVASGAEVVSADDTGSALASAPTMQAPGVATGMVKEGGEWSNEEIEMLRKLMAKHSKGTAKRWEVIATALGTGRSADDVVKMSKQMAEKKPTNTDSYAAFLAQRKDKPIGSAPSTRDVDGEKLGWTADEDQMLIRALKEFPKDTPARWERVAEAVPDKTKAQCFKRFGELKDSFRNAKSGANGEGETLE